MLDCSQVSDDPHGYSTGNHGWSDTWCVDDTHMYVRRSCPVLCGLCVPDADAIASQCPAVYGSKKPANEYDEEAGSGVNRKSPSSSDDEVVESGGNNSSKASGFEPQCRTTVILLHTTSLAITKLYCDCMAMV